MNVLDWKQFTELANKAVVAKNLAWESVARNVGSFA